MNMNPMLLLQLQQNLEQFKQNHPKFFPFLGAVRDNALQEGTVIEMKVTTPEGKNYTSNIKLKAEDVETVRMLLSRDDQQ
ncbi:MAG: hypothetical protein K6B72_03270 [Lachnospiraceae bacterium]|nr:hypothetical protein [Lachnospiraceae bacterium]